MEGVGYIDFGCGVWGLGRWGGLGSWGPPQNPVFVCRESLGTWLRTRARRECSRFEGQRFEGQRSGFRVQDLGFRVSRMAVVLVVSGIGACSVDIRYGIGACSGARSVAYGIGACSVRVQGLGVRFQREGRRHCLFKIVCMRARWEQNYLPPPNSTRLSPRTWAASSSSFSIWPKASHLRAENARTRAHPDACVHTRTVNAIAW